MLRVRIHVIFMNEVDKGYKHFIVYLYFLLCIIDNESSFTFSIQATESQHTKYKMHIGL